MASGRNKLVRLNLVVSIFLTLFHLSSPLAYGSADTEDPEDDQIYLTVVRLCSESSFEEARNQVRAWSRSALPTNPGAQELLGMIEIYAKNYADAEEHFKIWIQLQPELHEAQFNLAESIFLQGRFKEASAAFAKSAKQAEGTGEVEGFELSLYKQAVSLLAQKDFVAAERVTGSIREGSIAHRFTELASLYRKGETVKASLLLRECGESFPPELNDLYLDSLLELGWASQRESGVPFLVLEP